MRTTNLVMRHRANIPALAKPISDARQFELDDQIDKAYLHRMDMDPFDPRAVPFLLPSLWLWRR